MPSSVNTVVSNAALAPYSRYTTKASAHARDILNFKLSRIGSLLVRGSILTSTFIVDRALGGRSARKLRAVFARGEKGLKVVETLVRNLVIMATEVWRRPSGGERKHWWRIWEMRAELGGGSV